MRELLYDSAAELLSLVFYTAIASVLTLLGAMAELAATEDLSAGQTALGAWELGFGALLLFAGARVVVVLVLPHVRDVRYA